MEGWRRDGREVGVLHFLSPAFGGGSTTLFNHS